MINVDNESKYFVTLFHFSSLPVSGVVPLDKKRGRVSNSVYTNTVAKISLAAPYTLSTLLRLKASHFKNWLALANKTYIPFDKAMKYHPADDKYKIGKN